MKRVMTGLALSAVGGGAWHFWRGYTAKVDVPQGYTAPPLALDGLDRIPVLGVITRFRDIITRPVGLVEDSAQRYGDVFTIRIPTRFDLTYLLGREAYDTVLGLPAEHAAMGPVFGNVPTVGFWFPRRKKDHDSLQELVLTGKRVIAALLGGRGVTALPETIHAVVAKHTAQWPEEVDLSRVVYPAIYEICGRYFAGDRMWDRYGADLVPALRAIADGIDIPRATLAVTPYRLLMPEYRATRKLTEVLRRARREFPESPLFEAVRAADVHPEDADWMAMYVLWNAMTYPGSYGLWTLVDILDTPQVRAAVAAAPNRFDYLSWCMWESIRLSPISSLVRALQKPLTYEHGGKHYYLPEGSVVGVAPALLNRDPEIWPEPDSYLPERFRDTPQPRRALFGAGAFGCVAADFTRKLIVGFCDELLSTTHIELTAAPPQRRCRVHLTYPANPTPATATPRPAHLTAVA
ncbi:MAG: cytochrome P450 [Mycobacteriaceae bacterium]|nr:cytochrome P450 [Mycobacteriaceae bacterium]